MRAKRPRPLIHTSWKQNNTIQPLLWAKLRNQRLARNLLEVLRIAY